MLTFFKIQTIQLKHFTDIYYISPSNTKELLKITERKISTRS